VLIRVRRLAQAAFGPAERFVAPVGSVQFGGDAKVVPAMVIELGSIDGDDGIDVALGPGYRLPQVSGTPACRIFRIGGHDALAHHSVTLVA
jgi:hypothetical protein